MRINIFTKPDSKERVFAVTTTLEEIANKIAPDPILNRTMDRIVDKLAKALYPDIKKELEKQKPKMVKEITEKFIAESLDHLLKGKYIR